MIEELLRRYGVPFDTLSEKDGEVHVAGPLRSGLRYNLWTDRNCGGDSWELWDGRRRHTGKADPSRIEDMAFSALLCLRGTDETPAT